MWNTISQIVGNLTTWNLTNMGSQNQKRVTLIVKIPFSVILLMIVTSTPIAANQSKGTVVTCGDTINSPGNYFLRGDCLAPIFFEINITASNVTLHLMGNTIRSTGLIGSFGGFGIHAKDVSNVKILGPGTITGGFTYGVFFQNVSDSVIKNVSAVDNGVGIVLFESTGNTIVSNEANNNGYGIFTIDSDDNDIKGNEANGNSSGIYLERSNENRVKLNEANENKGIGILLSGSNGNEIERNEVNRNSLIGIYLQGFGNLIQKNSALRNGIDLRDTNCGDNRWEDNTFDTSDTSACVG